MKFLRCLVAPSLLFAVLLTAGCESSQPKNTASKVPAQAPAPSVNSSTATSPAPQPAVAPAAAPSSDPVDFVLGFRPREPEHRPSWQMARIDWADTSLKEILTTVYKYRSDALHEGRPFPAPMCEPPMKAHDYHAEKPSGNISMSGGVWLEKDIPILLHTFEYIARETILKWWNEKAPKES